MLAYLEKGVSQKLRILKWGDHYGLGCTLNPMTSVFKGERQREIWERQRSTEMRRRQRKNRDRDENSAVIVKECWQPPEVGEEKNGFSFIGSWREVVPADTLILDSWPPELWDNKCLWSFVIPVLGNDFNSISKFIVYSLPPLLFNYLFLSLSCSICTYVWTIFPF